MQAKARSLFQSLKSRAGEDYAEDFHASTGWFKRFKKRFALHNVRVTGNAGSADEDGAQKFVDSFDSLIKEEGYLPEQIFNVDEIELEAQRVVAEKAREEEDKGEEPEKKFTAKGLSDSFSQLNKALASFEAMDPNVERFTKVERIIQDAVCCYREKYEEKKKQTVQTKLLIKKTSPTSTKEHDPDDPQPSTSNN
jgi:hypothetical protein